MADLDGLPAFAPSGLVRVVVEASRGMTAKCKYDPECGLFVLGKPLPHGLVYPFDWGFIPSTRGDDGDPLDALILHDAACPVGCLVECSRCWRWNSRKTARKPSETTVSCYCPMPIRARRTIAWAQKVEMPSPVIRSFQYESDRKFLEVTFVSGRRYRYLHVPPETYQEMRASFSKGEYFNRHVRNQFTFEEIS